RMTCSPVVTSGTAWRRCPSSIAGSAMCHTRRAEARAGRHAPLPSGILVGLLGARRLGLAEDEVERRRSLGTVRPPVADSVGAVGLGHGDATRRFCVTCPRVVRAVGPAPRPSLRPPALPP